MLSLLIAGLALAEEVEHAAGHAAVHVPWSKIAIQAINVGLFLLILVWAAGRPVKDFLRNRSFAVARQIDESARLKDEASARFSDIEAKLVSLDRRIDEMKAEAEVDAQKEAVAIRTRAEADAQRVRETAERTIREESQRARHELRGEAAALAVQLARETIKRNLTADDQERLAREFLAAVERDRTTRGEA